MIRRDRERQLVRVWYERGVERGHYLKDVPYEDLSPEERGSLQALAHEVSATFRLIPVRRKMKSWKYWLFVEW